MKSPELTCSVTSKINWNKVQAWSS